MKLTLADFIITSIKKIFKLILLVTLFQQGKNFLKKFYECNFISYIKNISEKLKKENYKERGLYLSL